MKTESTAAKNTTVDNIGYKWSVPKCKATSALNKISRTQWGNKKTTQHKRTWNDEIPKQLKVCGGVPRLFPEGSRSGERR